MKRLTLHCHKCQHVWTAEPPLGRRDECPACRADAKCCLNCRYYDRGAHHECREDAAEWVKEKAQGNFCGYFEPGTAAGAANEAAAAKGRLDALFGGAKMEPTRSEILADALKRFLDGKK
jgi:hypothetical protein